GGRRGSTTTFELSGQGLPGAPVGIALPADGPQDHAHRLDIGGRLTNPLLLDLDDLLEYREPAPKEPVAVPAVLNGHVGRPGDGGRWAVSLKKGQACDFDLRAGRLGSPLRGVLTLLDAGGKELARAEAANGQSDPSLRFAAPTDGTYQVRVEERF